MTLEERVTELEHALRVETERATLAEEALARTKANKDEFRWPSTPAPLGELANCGCPPGQACMSTACPRRRIQVTCG